MRRKIKRNIPKDFVYFLHLSLDMIDYFQFSFIWSTPSLKKLQFFQTLFHWFTNSLWIFFFSQPSTYHFYNNELEHVSK